MSLELLCNFQYVGGMFAVRRELLEQFRNTDVEVFGNGRALYFDYNRKDPLDNNAYVEDVTEQIFNRIK